MTVRLNVQLLVADPRTEPVLFELNCLLKSSAYLVRGGANYDDHHGIGILARFPRLWTSPGYTDHINCILHFATLCLSNNVNAPILDLKFLTTLVDF